MLWIHLCRCGNESGCCGLLEGCELGNLTSMFPFGTCLLKRQRSLQVSMAAKEVTPLKYYSAQDVQDWLFTRPETACKAFTSGMLRGCWPATVSPANFLHIYVWRHIFGRPDAFICMKLMRVCCRCSMLASLHALAWCSNPQDVPGPFLIQHCGVRTLCIPDQAQMHPCIRLRVAEQCCHLVSAGCTSTCLCSSSTLQA